MYALLTFDTEDVYFPPDSGIDDIPGWLAEIMSEAGLTGTFFVMGEKAEALRQRGRQDVLDKMKPHAIASHQQGNRYPLLPQVVEGKGWYEGMQATREYEDWVSEQHVLAFGREPVGFSRHNAYFAPQHVAVAGERGLPYMYMISQLPESTQPLWYADTLTFPGGPNIYGGFDQIFSRDEIFAERFAGLQSFVDQRLEAGDEWICVFGCHPVQVMARDWLEHYTLGTGRARTPREVGWHYRTKPTYEVSRAQANFRQLCAFLKTHPDIQVVGIDEAARLFSTQPEKIGRDQLITYARQLGAAGEISLHTTFSPAELVCAMAESLIHAEREGDLPEEVPRRSVLGPISRAIVAVEIDIISHDDLIIGCRRLVEHVLTDGDLPANVGLEQGRLGIGQMAHLVARAYLAQARYDKYERLSVTAAPRYPRIAAELDQVVRTYIGEHWAMPLDFSVERMAEHSRQQTWTMKPAWLMPPQGGVHGHPFAGRQQIAS